MRTRVAASSAVTRRSAPLAGNTPAHNCSANATSRAKGDEKFPAGARAIVAPTGTAAAEISAAGRGTGELLAAAVVVVVVVVLRTVAEISAKRGTMVARMVVARLTSTSRKSREANASVMAVRTVAGTAAAAPTAPTDGGEAAGAVMTMNRRARTAGGAAEMASGVAKARRAACKDKS